MTTSGDKKSEDERPYRGSIVISNLPNPKMAKLLEEFDLDGSGTVSFEEMSFAAYLLRESKRYVKWGSVAIGVMCVLLTLSVVAQSVLIIWIVDSYQIADATDGALVDRKTGKPMKVGSSVFDATDGALVDRKTGKTMKVGSSVFEVSDAGILQTTSGKANVGVHVDYDENKVSSNLSDEQLREMRRFDVRSSSGNYISMQVLSVARHSKSDSKCGSVVVVYTFIGDMTIDGEQLTFNERVAGAFQNAGFAIAPSRRRLMGAIDLIGFFDMLVETTDYGDCPSTYKDMMVDGSWYTTTDIYRSCSAMNCLRSPYSNTEFPMIDSEQVWPTNDASLAVINGKAADKNKTFEWSEGAVDVDGEMFFKYTEHAYGEGVDNVFTSIEMKNFPNQRMNEIRNKTHLFTYNSWEGNNMFCHVDKDRALELKKANQAMMNEKFNEVEVNSHVANADFSKSKEILTIGGIVYNKWTYFNKMDNGGTLKQILYESYSTGKPWKSELWKDGELLTFSKYSFKAADGSSYGPADLVMDRKCVFNRDEINKYAEDNYPPFMMAHGIAKTVKPSELWLTPIPEESRRRLSDGSGCNANTQVIQIPGGITYKDGCDVAIDINKSVYGLKVQASLTVTNNDKIIGDVTIGLSVEKAKKNMENRKMESGKLSQIKSAIDLMNQFSFNIRLRDRKMQILKEETSEGERYYPQVKSFSAEGLIFIPPIDAIISSGNMHFGMWVMGYGSMKYFFLNEKINENICPGNYLYTEGYITGFVCYIFDCWFVNEALYFPVEREAEIFAVISETNTGAKYHMIDTDCSRCTVTDKANLQGLSRFFATKPC